MEGSFPIPTTRSGHCGFFSSPSNSILVLAANASPVAYAVSGNRFTENIALSPGAIALETATVVDSSVLVTNNRFEANQGGAISLSVSLTQYSTLAFTANVMTNSGGAVAISRNPLIHPGVGVVSITVIIVGIQVRGNIKRADGPGVALALDSTVDYRLVVENNTFDSTVGQGLLGGSGLLVQSFSAVSTSSVLIRGQQLSQQLGDQRFDCTITLEDSVMIGSFLPYRRTWRPSSPSRRSTCCPVASTTSGSVASGGATKRAFALPFERVRTLPDERKRLFC